MTFATEAEADDADARCTNAPGFAYGAGCTKSKQQGETKTHITTIDDVRMVGSFTVDDSSAGSCAVAYPEPDPTAVPTTTTSAPSAAPTMTTGAPTSAPTPQPKVSWQSRFLF
jgi:hypothetical protein